MPGISSALALLVPVAFAAQPATDMNLTRAVWQGREAGSPNLPESGFGLWFHVMPAHANGVRTLALLASARVPGRYAEIYGGRLAGAVQVVAISADSGEVYHATADPPGAVPLADVMNADPGPSPKGVAKAVDAEVWFNVDLPAHLDLPRAGAYDVFLWLDELTSQAIRAAAGKSAAGPIPSGGAIDLRLGADRQLHGTATAQVLTGARHLTILALDFRSRRFGVRTLTPHTNRFEIDPNRLLAGSGKVYFLAAIGTALSKVVTVETAGGPK